MRIKNFAIIIMLLLLSSCLTVNGLYVKSNETQNNCEICGDIPNIEKDVYSCGRAPLPDWVVPDEPNQDIILNDIPKSWDWREATYNNVTGNWMTPVKRQRGCGSCWDFAAHGALEAIINIRSNTPELDLDLSEQYLLSCAKIGGCGGSNAFLAYTYMATVGGTIYESCFPYTADDETPCSDKCSDWMEKRVPIIDFGVWIKPNSDFLKSCIVTHGPVVTGMVSTEGFHRYNGGIFEEPGDESFLEINHEVVLVGYNDEQDYWICKNSWGKSWGEKGYFRIAYGECQIGTEITYVDFNSKLYRPDKPKGEADGIAGNEYTYRVKAEHPKNKRIKFGWDWNGDFKVDEWTDYYDSNEKCVVEHKYDNVGAYIIQVVAKGEDGLRSGWSDPMPIIMPKTKFINQPFTSLFHQFCQFVNQRLINQ